MGAVEKDVQERTSTEPLLMFTKEEGVKESWVLDQMEPISPSL